jgi:hypothetical protein
VKPRHPVWSPVILAVPAINPIAEIVDTLVKNEFGTLMILNFPFAYRISALHDFSQIFAHIGWGTLAIPVIAGIDEQLLDWVLTDHAKGVEVIERLIGKGA